MREPASVFVLGKGTVGGTLLDRLASHRPEGIRVVGVADSRGARWGAHDRLWRKRLGASEERFELARLAALPRPILVDCTAAGDMAPLYQAALGAGVHVVSANKKPFAGPARVERALHAAARAGGAELAYETTVGAALPVLGPLFDLVRVGDEIERIEACLSGTLGYLAGCLERGQPLATAVAEAKALGYTEPDPRDDLSGADVARKALILCRALGRAIEPEEIELTPFAPIGRKRRGHVLRYLATIEQGRVSVGPRWLAPSHPAAALRGTDSLVIITSKLYSPQPLRIQGPGAGGAVTAGGVLADVLKVALYKRDTPRLVPRRAVGSAPTRRRRGPDRAEDHRRLRGHG
jgi:aspartokinase/homoserine dehydrogenase 1